MGFLEMASNAAPHKSCTIRFHMFTTSSNSHRTLVSMSLQSDKQIPASHSKAYS